MTGRCSCTSTRAEFVVTTVIIGAGLWDYMPRNLSLSITARIDRGVTRYDFERGRRCIRIGGDHGRYVLELQVRSWDLRDREDLEVVKTSRRQKSQNGGIQLRDGRIFRTEDDFGKDGFGGGSGMDSESCRFLVEALGS